MSEPLSEEWIKEQLRLCAKATPGPWLIGIRKSQGWPGLFIRNMESGSLMEAGRNAEFITAACEGYSLVLKELQDFYASFVLYSRATQMGRKLYLEEHPEFIAEFGDLAEPDTGEVVAWLVEQVRRRPWAECPRCGDMCLEQDMVDGLCARCTEEEP